MVYSFAGKDLFSGHLFLVPKQSSELFKLFCAVVLKTDGELAHSLLCGIPVAAGNLLLQHPL